MERRVKLLYRQRGSALRRVEQEVVIQDGAPAAATAAEESVEPPEEPADLPQLEAGDWAVGSPGDAAAWEPPEAVDEAPSAAGSPAAGGEAPGEAADEASRFAGLSATQLATSITSVATVEVLSEVVTALFSQQLAPQCAERFRRARTRAERLSYKLELRIFERLEAQVRADLRDIVDIHRSNNELCYQMKQILRLRHELTEELVAVRAQRAELDLAAARDSAQAQDLAALLRLNARLHGLRTAAARSL
ncbi:AAR150Cp [Eremothecium gossypii ATCC 10895]|uniref:AAR150Cp n=1 Tax=Eremothecium gossypii (strain ATCC 10895 / CBS 109.51 / FGSC 9923 / NRRL Y-1056) TaxID=284811 RepID=Q75EC4_EREGS|nr:AAR150Cp [Eremothecium gossypii ATCC 10895]AAS50517.1 AAR150Cp [Eremothecium gossypii ATCC 10895]